MSGYITVSSERVDDRIYFTEEIGARSPGWFKAECELCGKYATGGEPTVEDWAYEHVAEEHPKRDGTQIPTPAWHGLRNDLRLDVPIESLAPKPYTVRLAWFLPDAGAIWVRDFGRDFEFDINFSEAP